MSRLADAARAYIGMRFRHRGRSRLGVDCVGLGVLAYADCGVAVPDFRLYSREPHRDGLVAHMTRALGEPVHVGPAPLSELLDGDVIVLRFEVEPHHVGIVGARDYGGTTALTLIHADGEAGRVHEQRLTPDMAARITYVFRRPV